MDEKEPKKTKTCPRCSGPVYGSPSKVYCSRLCKNNRAEKRSRDRARERKLTHLDGTPKIQDKTRLCPNECGKRVVGHPAKKYCCKKCQQRSIYWSIMHDTHPDPSTITHSSNCEEALSDPLWGFQGYK